MTFEEFWAWLERERESGVLTREQMLDLLAQRQLFDENREWMQKEFVRLVVGFVANERLVDSSVVTLLASARRVSPGRMLYFEPIGYSLPL